MGVTPTQAWRGSPPQTRVGRRRTPPPAYSEASRANPSPQPSELSKDGDLNYRASLDQTPDFSRMHPQLMSPASVSQQEPQQRACSPVPVSSPAGQTRVDNFEVPPPLYTRHCIIINNEKFRHIPSRTREDLKEREGSSIDVKNLRDTFEFLKFKVSVHQNLDDATMVSVLDHFSKLDHRKFDCLVVCILSHGSDRGIYGSNSKLVGLNDLTDPFKPLRCPSLTGKPKLFFVQACQGRDKQKGHDYEKDAPLSLATIPNEADFLIGHATVPGFVSYRSRSQGSWYITKLTEGLRKFAHSEDILSILVHVNDEVSKAIALIGEDHLKQCPAPLVTLRKRLYFYAT